MTLSIVSPVYNSTKTIYTLIEEISKSVMSFTVDFEIILVDDGSTDDSWQVIENICIKNTNVKGIKLKRNYGQHEAICAGLEMSKGKWVVVLDCDLQDNPAEIPNLYSEIKDGNKIILAKRMNRKDSFLKKTSSVLFWKIISLFSKTPIHPLVGNFGIYHKDVINEFIRLKNIEPYFSIAMQKFNFKRKFIETEHQARMNNKSSYSIVKLMMHGFNVLKNTCSISFKKDNHKNITKGYIIEKITN